MSKTNEVKGEVKMRRQLFEAVTRAERAEAKLAKAVEVLRHSRAACLEAWGSHGAIHIDAVLAELEKDT